VAHAGVAVINELHQDDQPGGNSAVEIAVLRERVASMGREMRELKESFARELTAVRASQERQAEKMDAILTVMSEARGGWRTLMLVGGMSTTVGAGVAWLASHLFKGLA
jgi:hypothetical protein